MNKYRKDSIIQDFAQLLMDSNPQYIFWKDINGIYLGCNKLYAYFCNLKNTDAIIGTSDFDYMDPSEAEICISADKEVMTKGNALLNFEEYVTNAHGEAKWYSINKIPLKNIQGETIGVLGTMTDVTEIKSSNKIINEQSISLKSKLEELELKNQELEEFNYIVAHDLQEPLRNIMNFSSLIEKNKVYNEEYLQQIVDNSSRMADLLKALLNYSILGVDSKSLQPCKLNEVIIDAIEIVEGACSTNHLIIKDELPEILGYKEELISLFQNLFSNSLKYSLKDVESQINIFISKEDENILELCVQDNGIGFDNEHSKQVLKIFQRLHTNDKIEGLGIGLSICSKIMKMHQGHLSIDSQFGKGTKVFLVFNKHLN